MERNHRMELQYDGTGLHGWARQDHRPTVEGCLLTALQTVLGYAPVLSVAGRTDAGVHARRQVVSLVLPSDTDLARLVRSLNALTPRGIAITRLIRARAAFDARKDATSRVYRYFLTNASVPSPFWEPYCWHIYGKLDAVALHEAAAAVVGRHDFTAFTPTQTEHIFFRRQVLRCEFKRPRKGIARGLPLPSTGSPDGLFCLEIEAEAFLRRMVRALMGTMVEVAQGVRTLDEFRSLLLGATREDAGLTAPARGLFLWDVRYGVARGDGAPLGQGELPCAP